MYAIKPKDNDLNNIRWHEMGDEIIKQPFLISFSLLLCIMLQDRALQIYCLIVLRLDIKIFEYESKNK